MTLKEVIKMKEIIKKEQQDRCEGGSFGIRACKECIKFEQKYSGKSLYHLLEEYVKRASEDICFNKRMVLACYELIHEYE